MGFPSLIIDNFFEDPDKVVDYANTLEYQQSVGGKWPGKRSDHLNRLNSELFKQNILFFSLKIKGLFFKRYFPSWPLAPVITTNSFLDILKYYKSIIRYLLIMKNKTNDKLWLSNFKKKIESMNILFPFWWEKITIDCVWKLNYQKKSTLIV